MQININRGKRIKKRIRNSPDDEDVWIKISICFALFQSTSLSLSHIWLLSSLGKKKFPPRNSHSSRNRLSEVRIRFSGCACSLFGERISHIHSSFFWNFFICCFASPFPNLIAWRESEGISRVINWKFNTCWALKQKTIEFARNSRFWYDEKLCAFRETWNRFAQIQYLLLSQSIETCKKCTHEATIIWVSSEKGTIAAWIIANF